MISIKIKELCLKNIDLIIFDKDGTLFQLYPYCSRMAIERTEAICHTLNNTDTTLREQLILKMGVDLKNHRICPKGPIGVYSKYYAQDMLYDELNALGYPISHEALSQSFSSADRRINEIDYMQEALVPVDGMLDFISSLKDRCHCRDLFE